MNTANNEKNKKRATFIYHSSSVIKINNPFKETDINVAIKSTNTLKQLTKPKTHNTTQDHDKSELYKLICKTCNKAYVGETSRNLTLRFREHIRYIKNNDLQSAYAQHIPQNIHEYGSVKDTMSLLKPIHKMPLLVPYEKLLIQTFHHKGNLIPEQNYGEKNPLFQLAIDYSLA